MPSESSSFETIKPFIRMLEGSIEDARQRRLQQEKDDENPTDARATGPGQPTPANDNGSNEDGPRLARPTRFQSDQRSW